MKPPIYGTQYQSSLLQENENVYSNHPSILQLHQDIHLSIHESKKNRSAGGALRKIEVHMVHGLFKPIQNSW